MAATPVFAEPLHFSASASITETYTNNINYSSSNAEGGFVTSVSANIGMNGETGGRRLKLSGSIGLGQSYYLGQTQNNDFTPNINVRAKLEAIENFAFVDAQVSVSPTFRSPFGAQPPDIANSTQNRITQWAYEVTPYITGHFPNTNITYQVRDNNYWAKQTGYGDSNAVVPTSYTNFLTAQMGKSPNPWGWTLEYSRSYYDNGITNENTIGQTFTTQALRLIVPYQIDPELQVSGRGGTESNQYTLTDTRNLIYGAGGQWNPSNRTGVGGFWEHRFFGSAYNFQATHRLPNVALSATFQRDLSSYPQLALSIPAGGAVSQFVDAAFQTRIPDPVERARAVQQFLLSSGLPSTLTTPVSFYGTTQTVQQSAVLSAVFIGVNHSLTFSMFRSENQSVSRTGEELPPILQLAENNTQIGAGVGYSTTLFGRVNASAGATVSKTTANNEIGTLGTPRTINGNVNFGLGTQIGPKTSASANASYSRSDVLGESLTGQGKTSAVNFSVTLSHTFL